MTSSGELRDLTEVWLTHLRNEGKSPHTISSYRTAVRAYLGTPGDPETAWPGADLSRASVEAFNVSLLDRGVSKGSVQVWCSALRSFSTYLHAQGELAEDQLATLKAPRASGRVVRGLAPDEVSALIEACRGARYIDRRDLALVRLMLSAGVRCDEAVTMTVTSLDMKAETAIVQGKGSRERRVPFSGQTAEALAWYLRARKNHPLAAGTDRLWLGAFRSKGTFGYDGLYAALGRRADKAGIEGFHPHRLRHTFAGRWLRRGGSEGGLRKIAGWRSRNMVDRYVEDVAAELAAEEARRLNIGDD